MQQRGKVTKIQVAKTWWDVFIVAANTDSFFLWEMFSKTQWRTESLERSERAKFFLHIHTYDEV